jgi:ABC-type Fe3+/spermidine/putrescine transport system ATPase subunit
VTSLTKSYVPGVRVLDGIDLAIGSGEFFTLLGPSGCGKTTLLRSIAGFLRPDGGSIAAGTERIDTLPPHRRDIGMVFQDYAIFPHLTVAENVGFGLTARRMGREDIARRVADGLRMVRLEGYADRLPSDLSGGQLQRVGLARAMAIQPKLLLMDEPLSNLDAKLRLELREDIRELQHRLGITTIYVTHDQEEALAVSDRICVMHGGRIEQVAAPYELYHRPMRRFAAEFVGTMNFLPARIDGEFLLLGTQRRRVVASVSGPVELAIRPEDLNLGAATNGAIVLPATVRKCTFLGREVVHLIDTEFGALVHQAANPTPEQLSLAGRPVDISLPTDRITLFMPDGDRAEAVFPP